MDRVRVVSNSPRQVSVDGIGLIDTNTWVEVNAAEYERITGRPLVSDGAMFEVEGKPFESPGPVEEKEETPAEPVAVFGEDIDDAGEPDDDEGGEE